MHDTYNDTEYDTLSSKFLDTYTIHERYKNHRNWLCIQSSIHCSAPTKAAILYRVCIEVYRTRICSMDTTVDTRSIRLRYTFDTLRYKLWGKCTPIHGENPPSSPMIPRLERGTVGGREKSAPCCSRHRFARRSLFLSRWW